MRTRCLLCKVLRIQLLRLLTGCSALYFTRTYLICRTENNPTACCTLAVHCDRIARHLFLPHMKVDTDFCCGTSDEEKVSVHQVISFLKNLRKRIKITTQTGKLHNRHKTIKKERISCQYSISSASLLSGNHDRAKSFYFLTHDDFLLLFAASFVNFFTAFLLTWKLLAPFNSLSRTVLKELMSFYVYIISASPLSYCY